MLTLIKKIKSQEGETMKLGQNPRDKMVPNTQSPQGILALDFLYQLLIECSWTVEASELIDHFGPGNQP